MAVITIGNYLYLYKHHITIELPHAIMYRDASSKWWIEKALCEVTEGLCRIIKNKASWTYSTQ